MKNVFNFTSHVDRVRGSKLRLCFLCLTLIGSGLSLQARGNDIEVEQSYEQAQQQKEVLLRGLVTDKDKFPLPGVAVLVKGTLQGTTTDVNGEYSIKVKGVEKPVLVFSFVGMETQEIPYEKGKHQINVVLKESQQVMQEVVVTGIFNRPRESFTGSVKTVTSKELKLYRGQNLLSTLRNVDPSINMAMDNNLGSNPRFVKSELFF